MTIPSVYHTPQYTSATVAKTTNGTNRLLFVDASKGLVMFLVVIQHIVQTYLPPYNTINTIIQSFTMPTFMFISGYFSYSSHSINDLHKRFRQLIIPFLFWMMISPFIFFNFPENFNDLIQRYISTILYPDRSLWFLWALFWISVIYVTCKKIATFTRIHFLVIQIVVCIIFPILVVVCHFKHFGIHDILRYYLLFSLGGFIRYISTKPSFNEKKVFTIAMIIWMMAVPFYTYRNPDSIFYELPHIGKLIPTIIRFICNFSGAIAFFYLFKYLPNNRITHWAISLGKITLGIYFFHFFFIPPFSDLWNSIISPHLIKLNIPAAVFTAIYTLYVMLQILSITILSIFFVWLAKKNKLTAKLCLGTR